MIGPRLQTVDRLKKHYYKPQVKIISNFFALKGNFPLFLIQIQAVLNKIFFRLINKMIDISFNYLKFSSTFFS